MEAWPVALSAVLVAWIFLLLGRVKGAGPRRRISAEYAEALFAVLEESPSEPPFTCQDLAELLDEFTPTTSQGENDNLHDLDAKDVKNVFDKLKAENRLREKKIKCDMCDKTFSHKSSLKTHVGLHTGVKRFKCKTCQKGFGLKSDLKPHMKMCSGIVYQQDAVKSFKCKICNTGFTRARNLQRHIQMHSGIDGLKPHTAKDRGEKAFECNLCRRKFRRKDSLCKHTKHTHAKERRMTSEKQVFQCDVCGAAFSDCSTFLKHVRENAGKKTFVCRVCNKVFHRNRSLQQHLLRHTGVLPFKCDVCDKSFNDRNNRNRHKKLHFRTKRPYE